MLKNISKLQSGTYIRPSEDENSEKAYLLGIRDFDENLEYQGTAVEVDKRRVKEKYIIGKEDVLFSSRMQFNAFYLPLNSPKTLVASSSFIIIKPNLARVLPEYLIWFLNHPSTQSVFSSLSQATGRVSYISKSKLEELEIELPSLTKQRLIVDIYKLHRREKQLTEQLIQKKEQYIQNLLLKTSKQ